MTSTLQSKWSIIGIPNYFNGKLICTMFHERHSSHVDMAEACPSFPTSAGRSLNATYRFGKHKAGERKEEEGSDQKLRENQDTFKTTLTPCCPAAEYSGALKLS
jgi:hypothetical protein